MTWTSTTQSCDSHVDDRTGKYACRAVRYRAATDWMIANGLTHDMTIEDVGAGMTELDDWLRAEYRWRGRYIPGDGGIDGVNLNRGKGPARFEWTVLGGLAVLVENCGCRRVLRFVPHHSLLGRRTRLHMHAATCSHRRSQSRTCLRAACVRACSWRSEPRCPAASTSGRWCSCAPLDSAEPLVRRFYRPVDVAARRPVGRESGSRQIPKALGLSPGWCFVRIDTIVNEIETCSPAP